MPLPHSIDKPDGLVFGLNPPTKMVDVSSEKAEPLCSKGIKGESKDRQNLFRGSMSCGVGLAAIAIACVRLGADIKIAGLLYLVVIALFSLTGNLVGAGCPLFLDCFFAADAGNLSSR